MEFIYYYLIACGVFIGDKTHSIFDKLLIAGLWPVMLGWLLYDEIDKRKW